MSALLVALVGWLAFSVSYRLLASASLIRMCEPQAGAADPRTPPGTVVALRPLHGAGRQLESCLDSLWRAAKASRMRIVVAMADAGDGAAAVVARVRERWPETACRVAIGEGPSGINRKVSNQVQAVRGEHADFWLLSDADVRVPDDYAQRLLAPFSDSGVGLATCPYVSVPAATVVSRIDALVTNTHFIPNACLAARFEGLHFGLGATIAVRDEALAQIGGLASLLDLAADDFWLARKIEAAGWRLAWVPLVVEHALEDEGWQDALARHVRWSRVTRASRPAGYFGSIVTQDLPPALACAAALAAAGGPGWAVLLGWWALRAGVAWSRRELVRFRLRDVWLLPIVDLAALGVWVGGLFGSAEPPRGHAG
ncbi:MAG: glycosyltransferase [Deltaproteobacteria bacterium]|nr:glycosyltransferase [Deltaproteobacteria bacterium]